MMTADDDDDFIVPADDDSSMLVEEDQGGAPMSGLLGWGGLTKFVFSKKAGDPSGESDAPAPEPSLPPGFSALLNAEEEEIYPAEDKIRVIVAEGNLGGRSRRRATELHQSLQQVVSTAAIYCHLVRKHRGSGNAARDGGGERRKSPPSTSLNEEGVFPGSSNCGCGGADGHCKAISSLLKEELTKVAEAVEADRLIALERRLRRAERRSGGLCNPAQLETLVRNASLHGMVTPPASGNPNSSTPSSASVPWADGSPRRPSLAKHGSDSALSLSGSGHDGNGVKENISDAGSGLGLIGGGPDADTPWADDLLLAANRKRHAGMLRGRGRGLAKDLILLMPCVANEMHGVVARLPHWDDETGGDPDAVITKRELAVHGRRISSGTSTTTTNSNNRSRSGSISSGAESDASSFGPPFPQHIAPPPPVGNAPSRTPDEIKPIGTPPPSADRRSYSASLDDSVPTRPRANTAMSPNKPRPASMGRAMWSVFSSTGGMGASALGSGLAGGRTGTVSSFGSRNGAQAQGIAQDGKGGHRQAPIHHVERKKQRRDWKLSPNELSLIMSEEQRVMPQDVLGRLLAAGAKIQSYDQEEFWDVFARVEVATRTQALLNIAIRGGKGCRARAGRMGRELAMSLTSVVLDAIATVREQKQHALESGGGGGRRQDQSHQRNHEGRNETRHLSLQRGGGGIGVTPQRNLERITRRHAEGPQQRPDGPPRHIRDPKSRLRLRTRSAASAKKGSGRQIAVIEGVEDPGLTDLDGREREFRRAIFAVGSALSTRLLEMTRDAPLCAQVLSSFMRDRDTASLPPVTATKSTPNIPVRVRAQTDGEVQGRGMVLHQTHQEKGRGQGQVVTGSATSTATGDSRAISSPVAGEKNGIANGPHRVDREHGAEPEDVPESDASISILASTTAAKVASRIGKGSSGGTRPLSDRSQVARLSRASGTEEMTATARESSTSQGLSEPLRESTATVPNSLVPSESEGGE